MAEIFKGYMNRCITVEFVGRFTAANAAYISRRLSEDVTTGVAKNLVLDFSGLEALHAAALRELVIIAKQVKEAGGVIHIAQARPEILGALVLTGMYDSVFQYFPTVVEAVGSI